MDSVRYVVPDTCALAAALFHEKLSANTLPLLNAIRTTSIEAIAPSIGLAEFLNVARKKIASPKSGLSPAQVDIIVRDFLSLPITWWDMDEANTGITLRCWQLYWNHGIGTGDAYFLAVAQDFGAELWTTDGPFYTAASAVYTNTHNLYDKQFN